MARFYGLTGALDMDYLGTMSGSIYLRVKKPYLRDMFEYIIKYVGSSASTAPAHRHLEPNRGPRERAWRRKNYIPVVALPDDLTRLVIKSGRPTQLNDQQSSFGCDCVAETIGDSGAVSPPNRQPPNRQCR